MGTLGTESRVYRFGELPVVHGANGGESRDVLHGTIVTGEAVALHESVQPAGVKPNPAHTIEHTELILVCEGMMEFIHDGAAGRVGAGGVIFVAKGTSHQVRNVGEEPAKYFVISIGGDVHG